jgi:hypothetical protein
MLAALRGYGWDIDAPLATLGTQHVLSMLQRYLSASNQSMELTASRRNA